MSLFNTKGMSLKSWLKRAAVKNNMGFEGGKFNYILNEKTYSVFLSSQWAP